MPAVARPLRARGRLICQKVRKKPLPSMEAASFRSMGMEAKLAFRTKRLMAMPPER